MKYRLLAIDVDGTLLGPDHQPDGETIRALQKARAAGLRVCLATGRSYCETMPIYKRLEFTPPLEPMVVIGGALVSEPDTGRTLYQRTMRPDAACEFADTLGEAGYSAMAIVDSWRHGWDYVLCEQGDVHAAQRDWFSKMNVSVRRAKRLADVENLPNPLRISAVVDIADADELVSALSARFADRLSVHSIVAPNYGVTIVEAFAADANKWNALRYVCQGYRLGPGQVAAVGDDINDVPMIRGASLGVAMPDGSEQLKNEADYVAAEGLGAFVQDLIDGKFD